MRKCVGLEMKENGKTKDKREPTQRGYERVRNGVGVEVEGRQEGEREATQRGHIKKWECGRVLG